MKHLINAAAMKNLRAALAENECVGLRGGQQDGRKWR